jgi:importin-5
MLMLPPEIHTELTQLLQALQSSDNLIRSQAEEHLQNNWTLTKPEVLLMGLAEQIQNTPDAPVSTSSLLMDRQAIMADLRCVVAILCRRIIPAYFLQAAQK